mmetsp:Transcript_83912/g.140047  ORF Transcript_83912/g.140047 Transcript_83912/m.140047 type:complete len:418 (-) Transcript_83912:300-1553(-)
MDHFMPHILILDQNARVKQYRCKVHMRCLGDGAVRNLHLEAIEASHALKDVRGLHLEHLFQSLEAVPHSPIGIVRGENSDVSERLRLHPGHRNRIGHVPDALLQGHHNKRLTVGLTELQQQQQVTHEGVVFLEAVKDVDEGTEAAHAVHHGIAHFVLALQIWPVHQTTEDLDAQRRAGLVSGLLCSAHETTHHVIGYGRLLLLRQHPALQLVQSGQMHDLPFGHLVLDLPRLLLSDLVLHTLLRPVPLELPLVLTLLGQRRQPLMVSLCHALPPGLVGELGVDDGVNAERQTGNIRAGNHRSQYFINAAIAQNMGQAGGCRRMLLFHGIQCAPLEVLFEHELLLERDFSGSLMIDFGLPLLEPRSFDLPLCRFPLAVAQLLLLGLETSFPLIPLQLTLLPALFGQLLLADELSTPLS